MGKKYNHGKTDFKADFMVSLVSVGLFFAVIGAIVFVLNTVK